MTDSVYLFMEYIPHSLFDIIKLIAESKRNPFSKEDFSNCGISILKALVFMHGLPDKVIHRDLKVIARIRDY
jgi:serine/threonine protein kinase